MIHFEIPIKNQIDGPMFLFTNESDPLSVLCYPDHSWVKAVSLRHIVNKHIGISLGCMSCEFIVLRLKSYGRER